MNFFSKTLSSLTGTSIPYTIKEEVVLTSGRKSVWTIYDGLNPKTDNSPVTIFEFNLKDPTNISRNYVSLARNCFKKLKLIKFPGVVSVVDFIENDNSLFIVTEPVVSLHKYLHDNGSEIDQDAKIFGIHAIAQAISFVNMKCNCVLANLSIFNDSVFVTAEGNWKLFGFELLTNLTSDPDQPIYRLSGLSSSFQDDLPEDVASQGAEAVRNFPIKFDSYRLGVFIYYLFIIDDFSTVSCPQNVSSSQLANAGLKLPRQLATVYKRLVSSKSNLRITIEQFLKETQSFFESNKLVEFDHQLQEVQFSSDDNKLAFFKYELSRFIENADEEVKFPPGFLDNRLLPELIKQFNNLSIAAKANSTPEQIQQRQETGSILLNYILKFGSSLPAEKFNKLVKPIILNSFSSADRSIRLILLTHLPQYCQNLNESEVQQKVFHNLITGFQDSNFMIRESTLTSIICIIDKVSAKQINQDLLKVLARSQMDPKPSIRTNTLVLITKISDKIYSNSKNNVLITALSKSLRDSFVPCKMTALSGFEQLIDQFSLEEICTKILGHLAVSLMDPKSGKVRREAKRIFTKYLDSVEKHAATLKEDEEDEDAEEREFFKKNVSPSAISTPTTETPQLGGGLGFNFGWNVVSKLVSTEGQLNHEFKSESPTPYQNLTPGDGTISPSKEVGLGRTSAKQEIRSNIKDNLHEPWGLNSWNFEDSEPETKPKPASSLGKSKLKGGERTGGLKLGQKLKKPPGSTLKLDLTVDEDWGDSW